MAKKTQVLCPKCYEPVIKNGTGNNKTGHPAQQYIHPESVRKHCKWQGTAAVGAKAAKRTGIPEDASKRNKAEILEAKGTKVKYVVTSAQNATPVHERALQSLLTYCKVNDARLLVIPYRYKNPTSIWSKRARSEDWWAEELKPYIIGERVFLSKHLVLLGDIMTQPTAERPLDGFETITGQQSAIVGHPKLELTTVPTPQEKLPKLLTTTGSVTRRNYIESKAGKKGEFHHTFGACVVEMDGEVFHLRQLNMRNDGSFCDLLAEYAGDEVRKYDRVPALVMGDTHVEVVDPQAVRATFEAPDSMVKYLRPETLVWHDLHDGTAKNHHDRGKAFHEYVKHHSAHNDVEAEVLRTFLFLDRHTPDDARNVVVPSNHNDFLKEWVQNTDPRTDPVNGRFWCETFLAIVKSPDTKWTPSGVVVQDPFAFWGRNVLQCSERTKFLRRGESHVVKGIEVGFHGDIGPGGAKGSRAAFRRIGVKSVIGHGHAPGIMDGCYQVGTTSRLDLTYAAGSPSAWLNTHCVIYPNGKRALLSVIDGRWRA